MPPSLPWGEVQGDEVIEFVCDGGGVGGGVGETPTNATTDCFSSSLVVQDDVGKEVMVLEVNAVGTGESKDEDKGKTLFIGTLDDDDDDKFRSFRAAAKGGVENDDVKDELDG